MYISNKIIALLCFSNTLLAQQKPNIVYILADDLGYGELGCYGQKIIETPNIDRLAKSGLRFTQHYAGAPVCAPSRCTFLTGKHTGHAHVRGNDEWASRGDVWSSKAMLANPHLEGQRPLPDSIFTIAEMLGREGYTSGIFGKWGLGAPDTEGVPNKQGFDSFFGYNCQRQAHTYYPPFLWENEHRVYLKNKLVPIHADLAPNANPNDPTSYTDFTLTDYAPDLIHAKALSFIEQNAGNPFFLYYASPVPHVPLQAPARWVKYYEEKLGPEEPYTQHGYYPNRTPRATYAAMISYLDEQVGELVAKLEKLNLLENTLIVFTSDNGPSWAGGAPTLFFDSAAPFSSEFGRGKASVYEGGIRVPMIASWPGKVPVGTSNHRSVFYDMMPTFADLIGIESPATDGISIKPTLLGLAGQKKHDSLYWEFPENSGSQALISGNWKIIRKNLHKGDLITELYNLKTDLTESHNLATDNPEKVAEFIALMKSAHQPAAIEKFRMKVLDGE